MWILIGALLYVIVSTILHGLINWLGVDPHLAMGIGVALGVALSYLTMSFLIRRQE